MDEIRKQLKMNMNILGNDEFVSSFTVNGKHIQVSFYRYEEHEGLDYWILRFRNTNTNEHREFWVPYFRTRITKYDVIEIAVTYIEKGYVQDLI